jgi:hypothetical protein
MKKTNPLPAEFVSYLTAYISSPRFTSVRRMHRGFILRWVLWQDGHEGNAIPGYATCPPAGRNDMPAGWTYENFRDIARDAVGVVAIAKCRSRAARLNAR